MIVRISLMTAGILVGLHSPSFAQASLADEISVCARISKKDARLACYDSVAQAARQGTSTSTSATSAPVFTPPAAVPTPQKSVVSPPPAPAQDFGAEQVAQRSRTADAETNEIQASVTSSRDSGMGLWQFEMADGALWRMTERVAQFRAPAANEVVTIRKGALGSYLMKVGRQGAVRVMRVR